MTRRKVALTFWRDRSGGNAFVHYGTALEFLADQWGEEWANGPDYTANGEPPVPTQADLDELVNSGDVTYREFEVAEGESEAVHDLL